MADNAFLAKIYPLNSEKTLVFFDPKKAEVDIVQAIGRAIRQSSSTAKEYGTIVVPLVVPSNIESAEFLEGSEYRKVAQVMRALRAHDDRFEVRLKDTLRGESVGGGGGGTDKDSLVVFDLEMLSEEIKRGLTAKVLKVGAGIVGDLLTEAGVIEAARNYYKLHGRLPTANSREEVPGMKGHNWHAIDAALTQGNRGLERGGSLSKVLAPLRKSPGINNFLTEESILKAAKRFYSLRGRLPHASSKESVPYMPGENWAAINAAGRLGNRSLAKGRVLTKIITPLRKELGLSVKGLLSERMILTAALKHLEKFGKLPSKSSKQPLHEMPGDTWNTVNAAGQRGMRGLASGRTLSAILQPLKFTKGNLEEGKIIKAARKYYKLYQKLPGQKSLEPVPGMDGENWSCINTAAHQGLRGLKRVRLSLKS